jgi:acetyltransferase-like isoleucine patch superfamily enzyme
MYDWAGPEVIMFSKNHIFDNRLVPTNVQGVTENNPVVRSNDFWIATKAMILSGIHIGRGAIVSIGAVVSRGVPVYVIVVGNFARVMKQRV